MIPRGSLKYKKKKLRQQCEKWSKQYKIFKQKSKIVSKATKEAKKYKNSKTIPKELKGRKDLLNSKDTWIDIFRVKCYLLSEVYDRNRNTNTKCTFLCFVDRKIRQI